MTDDLLTTSEAAELLKVHRDTVARWIRLGQIEAMKLPGGQYRVARAVVDELLRQLRQRG
jgi:excisionase family DNA binding protein